MNRDVPKNSGMFRVPGFIDARTVRATTRSGYMMTSSTFAKWRPRRETRGKVSSWLFAVPRSVLSPYYFESCDFRQ